MKQDVFPEHSQPPRAAPPSGAVTEGGWSRLERLKPYLAQAVDPSDWSDGLPCPPDQFYAYLTLEGALRLAEALAPLPEPPR